MKNQSIFRDHLFEGQSFLVTGVGSGIGACVAREPASLGAGVGLVGRNEEKLRQVAGGLEQQGVQVAYYGGLQGIEEAAVAIHILSK